MIQNTLYWMHKMFGPIRRFKYLPNDQFICFVKTPGFIKEDLHFSFTPNNLIELDGDKTIYDKNTAVYRVRINELIHIPIGVKLDHIKWTIENGITVIRCHREK